MSDIICECGHPIDRHEIIEGGWTCWTKTEEGMCFCTKSHADVLRAHIAKQDAALEEAKALLIQYQKNLADNGLFIFDLDDWVQKYGGLK